jgi:putative ABC transport system ATP-binding protein
MSKKRQRLSIGTKELIKDFTLPGGEVVHVLTGVEMKIKRGEFIAIMGPSGSGKSTLLNILSTLESITSGEVLVAGIDLSKTSYKENLDIRRTKTSVVFQNFALIPYLTAIENVKLPMKLRKIPEKEAEERATGYLESVGLYARMDHLPEELSGGEQQRVAIARALAHDPAIIYADEPTGNLDTTSGQEIIELFKELTTKKKITIIMVTHDTECAKEADKIFILQKGKIVQEHSINAFKKDEKEGKK